MRPMLTPLTVRLFHQLQRSQQRDASHLGGQTGGAAPLSAYQVGKPVGH
jgi:hypothetical protein